MFYENNSYPIIDSEVNNLLDIDYQFPKPTKLNECCYCKTCHDYSCYDCRIYNNI